MGQGVAVERRTTEGPAQAELKSILLSTLHTTSVVAEVPETGFAELPVVAGGDSMRMDLALHPVM